MYLQLLPNICSSICLRSMFVWLRKYKCGPTELEVWRSSFSVFTWDNWAGLGYLRRVRSTAYSGPLLSVCRRRRARRLLGLLRKKTKRKAISVWENVDGTGGMYISAHLCTIHHCLSQSPPPPGADWRNRAAAPAQTRRALDNNSCY